MTRHRGMGPGELFVRLPHEAAGPNRDVWQTAMDSPEFRLLRARLLRFTVPATVGFLGWYFLYIALNAWAPALLERKVLGITVVLLVAAGQFASTFAITIAYTRYATSRLDPLADEIRTRLEAGRP